MDIAAQIASLIEQVKALSNSLARNKCASHLADAEVWAEKLKPKTTEAQAECICPVGGRHRDCPVHKNN
jgi:hypothetical protein